MMRNSLEPGFSLTAVRAVMACILSLAPAAMLAQPESDRQAAVAACARIENDDERLACFDALSSPEPEPAPAPEISVAPSPPEASPAPERGAGRSTDRRDRQPETRTVVVVEVQRSPLGQTVFVTDRGDVLEQTSPRRGRYPPAPFETVLETASRDTYFLTSPLGGPKVRVVVRD